LILKKAWSDSKKTDECRKYIHESVRENIMAGTFNIKNALKKNTMFIALIIVMLLFQALIIAGDKGSLFAPANISNLISQNAYVVILASGMLLCILTGGNIDLSVGSIVALVGAVAGTLIVSMKCNIYISMLICLILGLAIGAWQGFWIAYVRIPPFIVTLAGMLLWRGVALLILNGLTISPFPDNYLRYFTSFLPVTDDGTVILSVTMIVGIVSCTVFVISQIIDRINKKRKGYDTEFFALMIARLTIICIIVLLVSALLGQHKGIPVVLILLAVIVFAYSYFTQKTVPGRHLYALGGNEKATRLSGINTNRVMFFAYANMGFLSAVAALVCVARFNSASPSAGTNYEMDAIGSCFIGGASAYGGTGTVGGAIIGAIFMGVLNNGMSILGIDANWQKAVKGLVLLSAVVFDVISKKRTKTS
jgi:putative multiple sugar transport system permease protein